MKLPCKRYVEEKHLSTEQFQELLVKQGFWFHNFEFENGCTTFGRDPSERKLRALELPALQGKSVIEKIRGENEIDALSRPLTNGRAVFHAYV